MKNKTWLIIIVAASMSGCYSRWTGGEDLDGKAREIADSYRYSKFTIREEQVTSPDQDAIKVTVDFYYYRQPKTLSYNRYIIPGKYTSPIYGRYSGFISQAVSDAEAKRGAEESLLKNILQEPLRRAVNDGLVDELLNLVGDDASRADALLARLIQEDPQILRNISEWEVSRYSKYVTPEIDATTLAYLVQRGVLGESAQATYHCHAVLVEMNDDRRFVLTDRVNTALNRLASAALEQKRMAVFQDIWRGYMPVLSTKLGLNSGSLALAEKPETVIDGLKLELARIDRIEPSIRIKALIIDGDMRRPASGAIISVNGKASRRADAAGQILLDKALLVSSCLKGDLISAHFQFEVLRDLALDFSRKGLSDTPWVKSIESTGLNVSFRYEGKARIVGIGPILKKTEGGLIFKKLKAVAIRGSLKEENYVPVVLNKALIHWSFFNESQRKAVDFQDMTRSVNISLRNSANYQFDLTDEVLLEKIKKYRSSEVVIKFEGKDSGGRPVSYETKSSGQFVK